MNFAPSAAKNPHGDGRYIPALDGWRAVAILVVMLFHGLFNTDTIGHPLLKAVARVSARVGALGVLIFFAISGYIITTRLYDESAGGRISLRVFYTKRAFRILPPMALYLLTLLLLYAAHVITLQRNDWSAPVFLSNYFPGSWHTRHFWSLSVEEHFYLFWPLIILLAGWRRALWIGIAICTAVAVYRPWALSHLLPPVTSPAYEEARGILLSHTESRLDYIMMGCIIALAVRFYPVLLHSLHSYGSTGGMVFLLVMLGLTTVFEAHDLRTPQAVSIALLVCGSSLTMTWFSTRILSHRWMLFIGKLSYSLYLWQQLFLAWSRVPFLRTIWGLPIKFAAAIAAAWLSYNYIERPLIRTGRRFLSRWEKL